MAEKMSEVYEMYDLVVERTSRGRGAILLSTDKGIRQLRQTSVGETRLRTEYQLKEKLAEQGFAYIDRLVETREGELISYDRYGNGYVMREFFDGREMNVTNKNEILMAVDNLAKFHQAGGIVWRQTEGDVQVRDRSNVRRRNREMKRVHAFIGRQSPKREFEELYVKAFTYFYQQGLACECMEVSQVENGGTVTCQEAHTGYCHGSYNHHSVLLFADGQDKLATINFDKFYVGNQLRDLYHFLRKTVEKNGYNYCMMETILLRYGESCPLSKEDLDFIYRLYCYPEKFYKISNQYINSAKNWISPKSLEKLKQIIADEPKKQELLHNLEQNKYKLKSI